MQSQTKRYLDLARLGANQWWRYALGAVVIVAFWLGLGSVPYLLLAGTGLGGPLAVFVAINLNVFMMLAGLAITVKLIHRRTLLSLITPDARIDWRRAARGAAAWLVIAAAATAIEHALYPDRYFLSFNPGTFLPFLGLVLVLTPIQSATEELVFRGYLVQGLGLLSRRPAVVAVLSSLAFTAPHMLGPDVYEQGALIMVANYFVIGMLLATVTLRDGRLELAIGLHAANNVFLALIANYEGSPLMTDAVFTAREFDPVYSLVTLVIGAFVFHWWVFGRAARKVK